MKYLASLAVAALSAVNTILAAPLTTTSYTSGSYSGEATFYGGNVDGGTCSFYGYTIPSNLFGVALTDAMWDSAGHCGACISVKGPKGNLITAMVVDQCPGCGTNHLDLFQNAFAKLDDISRGIIPVTWNFVSCGITSPIILKSKSGTSQWWFSMQVMNSNVPVTTLEVSTDGGKTWQGTTRRFYNFFENPSGFGNKVLDVRVTSITGAKIIVKNVSYAPDAITKGTTNFA